MSQWAPAGAEQLNEDASCSSGGSSVVRENEAIFGANEGSSTQIRQEEIQVQLNPQLSQFPSSQSFLLPLTTCPDPVRIELDCQGAARTIWSLRGREPGAACNNKVGIPQYPGEVSRADLEMAGCVTYRALGKWLYQLGEWTGCVAVGTQVNKKNANIPAQLSPM